MGERKVARLNSRIAELEALELNNEAVILRLSAANRALAADLDRLQATLRAGRFSAFSSALPQAPTLAQAARMLLDAQETLMRNSAYYPCPMPKLEKAVLGLNVHDLIEIAGDSRG